MLINRIYKLVQVIFYLIQVELFDDHRQCIPRVLLNKSLQVIPTD